MENKKINKLVVPLTLRTASILSAFTLMATSVGGCVQKNRDDNNNDEIISSTILPNDNDEDIKKDLDNKVDDNKNEEQKEVDNGITENNNNVNDNKNNSNSQNSNSTSEKNNTGSNNNINNKSDNNNTVGNNNTGDNNNNNGNNNSQDPSQKDDDFDKTYGNYPSLSIENINDINIFYSNADRLCGEVCGKNTVGTLFFYDYKGERFPSTADGFSELCLILALANKQYLNNNTLHDLFEKKTEDDLRRYTHIAIYFDIIQNHYQVIDWTKYVLEPGLGSYINTMENEAYNQLTNGQSSFSEKFDEYFYQKNGAYAYGNNAFLDTIITQYAVSIYKDNPRSKIYFDVYYAHEDSVSQLENEAANVYSRAKVLKK